MSAHSWRLRTRYAARGNIKETCARGVPIAAGVLYSVFGLPLSPIIAAAAISFSSVSVLGNGRGVASCRTHSNLTDRGSLFGFPCGSASNYSWRL